MRNSKPFLISCFTLLSLLFPTLIFAPPALAAAPQSSPQSSLQASPQATPPKLDKSVKQRARLNDDVLRLSQPLKCKADSDCSALALGVKPCGGPWKYVLYSKKNSKITALKKKVAEYNKLDQKINESQQMMSDCSKTAEPEPKCENSMCVDSANVNAANASAGFEKITPAPPPHPVH